MAGSVPRPSCVRGRQDGRALCSSGVSPLVGSELGTAPPPRAAARDGLGLVGFSDDAGGRWSAGPGLEDASEPDGATVTLVRQTRPPVINSVTPCARARPFRFRTRLARRVASPPPPSFSSRTDSPPIPSLTRPCALPPWKPYLNGKMFGIVNRQKAPSPKGGKARFFDFLRPARLLAYTDCAGVLVPVAEPRPGRAPPPPTPPGRSRVQKGGAGAAAALGLADRQRVSRWDLVISGHPTPQNPPRNPPAFPPPVLASKTPHLPRPSRSLPCLSPVELGEGL